MAKVKEKIETDHGNISWLTREYKRTKPKKKHKALPPLSGKSADYEFQKTHRFDYMDENKNCIEFVFYLINLHAPTHSGYLIAKERAMWAMPTLCNMAERAYTMKLTPSNVMPMSLKLSQRLPKYYYLVAIPLAEALMWQRDGRFDPYDKGKQEYGAIKYF